MSSYSRLSTYQLLGTYSLNARSNIYLPYLLDGRVTLMSAQGSQTGYVSFVIRSLGVLEVRNVGVWACGRACGNPG